MPAVPSSFVVVEGPLHRQPSIDHCRSGIDLMFCIYLVARPYRQTADQHCRRWTVFVIARLHLRLIRPSYSYIGKVHRAPYPSRSLCQATQIRQMQAALEVQSARPRLGPSGGPHTGTRRYGLSTGQRQMVPADGEWQHA